MNVEKFERTYNESRNGANELYYNPLYRDMKYSDGVQDCAEAGCYWLVDIIGTECLKPLRDAGVYMGIVTAEVKDGKAKLYMTTSDYGPAAWTKDIEFTDMPEGKWAFFLTDDQDYFTLILPSEY